MGHWVAELYRAMDAGDLEAVEAHLSSDMYSRFGSFEPTTSRAESQARYAELVPGVVRISHRVLNLWDVAPDTAVVEFEVTYSKENGTDVVLPATTIIRHQDQVVRDMRVYMDINPVASA